MKNSNQNSIGKAIGVGFATWAICLSILAISVCACIYISIYPREAFTIGAPLSILFGAYAGIATFKLAGQTERVMVTIVTVYSVCAAFMFVWCYYS